MIVDVNDSAEGTAHSLTQRGVGICSSNQQSFHCLVQKQEQGQVKCFAHFVEKLAEVYQVNIVSVPHCFLLL